MPFPIRCTSRRTVHRNRTRCGWSGAEEGRSAAQRGLVGLRGLVAGFPARLVGARWLGDLHGSGGLRVRALLAVRVSVVARACGGPGLGGHCWYHRGDVDEPRHGVRGRSGCRRIPLSPGRIGACQRTASHGRRCQPFYCRRWRTYRSRCAAGDFVARAKQWRVVGIGPRCVVVDPAGQENLTAVRRSFVNYMIAGV